MSLAHAAMESLRSRGADVVHNDLYHNWDPRMARGELSGEAAPDTHQQQQSVLLANLLVFVFPVWWWSPPAALQGWLERVMSVGFAFKYDVSAGRFVGCLSQWTAPNQHPRQRSAVIVSSSGSDPQHYPVDWQRGSHLNFVSDIMDTCGIEVARQFHFHGVSEYAPKDQLADHIETIRDYFASVELSRSVI